MKNQKVKRMTGIAILTAVTIVLALISNNVTIATVNINLALIPLVVGACIYGPTAGLLLGIVDGALICTVFFSVVSYVFITVFVAKISSSTSSVS